MSVLFSPKKRAATWRRLWVALAKGEQKLGLSITDEQIAELEAHIDTTNFERVHAFETHLRHDVMAHIHAYGEECPKARPIIHLGATSTYVTDNGDLILMREAMQLLLSKGCELLKRMEIVANEYAPLPTLGYTHFQPAQPTTLGKRVALWMQDFLIDARDLADQIKHLPFLGVKGATGTQSSFLQLFERNEKKVEQLETFVAKEMGFFKSIPLSGQTYPRKIDARVFGNLSRLAESSHKCATDLRLLAHLGEIEEPFKPGQVGSSAMPHKRNPILSERICSLSRYLISQSGNFANTAAHQWLERTLDDSANRRLSIPEIFLAADGILNLLLEIFGDLQVYPKVIAANLKRELPFLALENILLLAVQRGKDRQDVHKTLRQHALRVQSEEKKGNRLELMELIASDTNIGLTKEEIHQEIAPETMTGMARSQTIQFLHKQLSPFLAKHKNSHTPIESINI